jgi:hypothetical protein
MTIHYLLVEIGFEPTSSPDDSDDAFDAFTDAVMDALLDLQEADPGIVDPNATAALTERAMSVLMGIEADSARDAVRIFAANVRAALHAAGCWTPNWTSDLPAFKPPAALPVPHQVDLADA